MVDAGWNLDVDPDTKTYGSVCGSSTFWGYRYGNPIGKVQASFHGSGTAKLIFGQCYTSPQAVTNVYLNDVKIKNAATDDGEVTVTFDYKPGDTLRLEEVNTGIIKISSLVLTCKGLYKKNVKIRMEFYKTDVH